MSCSDPHNLFTLPCADLEVVETDDGKLYINAIKPGASLYSGNAILYSENTALPIGGDYYDYNINNDKELSNEFINSVRNQKFDDDIFAAAASEDPSLSKTVMSSWYGSVDTARVYSVQSGQKAKIWACLSGNCVTAVKVMRRLPLLYFGNDDYGCENLLTLMRFAKNNHTVPEDLAQIIINAIIIAYFHTNKKFINIINLDDTTVDSYYALQYYNRYSEYENDHEINAFIRDYFAPYIEKIHSVEIAGYCSNFVSNFHEEFCIWNAAKYLRRDLQNPDDYMYNSEFENAPELIKKWIRIMEQYQTYNIFGHQGNLLDHSIWTLLNAEEDMVRLGKNSFFPKNNEFYILSGICAFLHDLGKMNTNADGTFIKQNYVAYMQGNTREHTHGDYGADFIKQNGEINGVEIIDVVGLMAKNAGYSLNYIQDLRLILAILCFVNYKHYDLGMIFKNYAEEKASEKHYIYQLEKLIKTDWLYSFTNCIEFYNLTEYLNSINTIEKLYETAVSILIVVSISDMKGSLRYIEAGKKTNFVTQGSFLFPYINNRPASYPGSTKYVKNINFIIKTIEKYYGILQVAI